MDIQIKMSIQTGLGLQIFFLQIKWRLGLRCQWILSFKCTNKNYALSLSADNVLRTPMTIELWKVPMQIKLQVMLLDIRLQEISMNIKLQVMPMNIRLQKVPMKIRLYMMIMDIGLQQVMPNSCVSSRYAMINKMRCILSCYSNTNMIGANTFDAKTMQIWLIQELHKHDFMQD